MAAAKNSVPCEFDPREALRKHIPERAKFQKLVKATRDFLECAYEKATRLEMQGEDTSYLRAVLSELHWRVGSTIDVEAIRSCRARCEMALADPDPPSVQIQDQLGSYGPGALPWFLKLDCSTDRLVDEPRPGARPPLFLDRIKTPKKMVDYLDRLRVCDLSLGVDTSKELNLASAVIARLALWGGQAGYLHGDAFEEAFGHFLQRWQDEETGFFCVRYINEGREGREVKKTVHLSITFHMVRYASRYRRHRQYIQHWPQLIDTPLAIKDKKRTFPQGWFDEGPNGPTMTNHNNYDVVELLRLGCRSGNMTNAQKASARREVAQMLDWCLLKSVSRKNGRVADPNTGDPPAANYYFAAAFLDTIGFFDGKDELGIGRNFSDGPALRTKMIKQLARFRQNLPDTIDALARLGFGPKHVWTKSLDQRALRFRSPL